VDVMVYPFTPHTCDTVKSLIGTAIGVTWRPEFSLTLWK